MNRFVTGDGAPRTPERAEMLARVDPTLDRPVILFQDVIEPVAASRLAERRKSIVAPLESTARYKYTHLPFTRTYVSSTRHESFVGLRCRHKRRSSSGAYRWTHLPPVT